jgi:hypothetical protein
VAESLRIVEHRYDFRNDTQQHDALQRRWRHGGVFRVALQQHRNGTIAFRRVRDLCRECCHGKAGDAHRVRRVAANRERYAVVVHDIGVFLAVTCNDHIDAQGIVGIADDRGLWPPVGTVGGDRKDAVAVQQSEHRLAHIFIHGGLLFVPATL